MNSLYIAANHTRAQPNVFANKTWQYPFRELPFVFEEKRLKKWHKNIKSIARK